MEDTSSSTWWMEQTCRDLPPNSEWLSVRERSRLAAIRVPKRRADWLLGRWTAKLAAASRLYGSLDLEVLASFEVRPASSGAPELFEKGVRCPFELSISHSGGVGFSVIAAGCVGCDIEVVEARNEAFVSDYFTPSEQALVAATPLENRSLLSNLVWSAKESAMKALHEGLRLDTRDLNVTVPPERASGSWFPLLVSHQGREPFPGWWRAQRGLVRTIVEPISAGFSQDFSVPHECQFAIPAVYR